MATITSLPTGLVASFPLQKQHVSRSETNTALYDKPSLKLVNESTPENISGYIKFILSIHVEKFSKFIASSSSMVLARSRTVLARMVLALHGVGTITPVTKRNTPSATLRTDVKESPNTFIAVIIRERAVGFWFKPAMFKLSFVPGPRPKNSNLVKIPCAAREDFRHYRKCIFWLFEPRLYRLISANKDIFVSYSLGPTFNKARC